MGAAEPPIFALHGWGFNAASFAPCGGMLGGRRLIAADLPGHGSRRAETLPQEPDALVADLLAAAPARAVWLGWSLGGLLALAAAATAPRRVAALVLVATAASFVARPDWRLGMPSARLERMGKQLQADPDGTVHDFLTLQVLASRDARRSLRQLRAALAARGSAAPAALAAGLELLRRLDLRRAASTIQIPALVVGGGRDRLVRPEAVRDLGARLAGAETVLFEDAGHVPFLSHRKEFSDLVSGFLDRQGKQRVRA